MKIQGTMKVINDLIQVTDSFKKKEFVITDSSGKYPQHILIQTTQDRTSLLDAFKVGDEVEVDINLNGREWVSPDGTAKYFNSLDAWKITAVNRELPSDAPKVDEITGVDDDGLPF